MLTQAHLARVLLPVGELTKRQVRDIAAGLGLRTAAKPDSQDVCFISRSGGRREFLGSRIPLRPARVVDGSGALLGEVPAVELVTLGQRRGLGGLPGPGEPALEAAATTSPPESAAATSSSESAATTSPSEAPVSATNPPGPVAVTAPAARFTSAVDGRRYVIAVDVDSATITVGPVADLLVTTLEVRDLVWVDDPPAGGDVLDIQVSAHGRVVAGTWSPEGIVTLGQAIRRVAPGQSVVLYRGDTVVGGGIAVGGKGRD
jgi:tRNA-specific 2-thiouridylase